MHHIFYSLISFFVGIFFILLGVISMLLPWTPLIRAELIRFMQENSLTIFLFGAGFLSVGIAIVLNILINSKRQYYTVCTEPNSISIDKSLIQDYLKSYWDEIFPDREIPYQVLIKNNKIHIQADLPYIVKAQQEILIENIKKDLKNLFSNILGYNESFYLSISFQSEKQAAAT